MKYYALALTLLATSLMTAPLSAAVFNVNDEAGLSAAITTSNSNGEDDTINIAAGTITLTAALPQVVDDSGFGISIIGAGQTSTIVEAGDLPQELAGGTGTHNRRVFYFDDSSTVSVSDMTVRHGRLSEASPYGANIHSRGELIIERCTISEAAGLPTTQGRGSGIYVHFSGSLSMSDCLIVGNLIEGSGFITAGAGLYTVGSPISIYHSTFEGNVINNDNMGTGSTAGGGGAYLVGGTLVSTIVGSTFLGNQVNDTSVAQTATAGGGGLVVGSNIGGLIRNCTFSNNHATDWGGGLDVARYSSGVFPNISLEGCTITANTSDGNSGGIFSRKGDFRNCIIAGNTAPVEPDIRNNESAVLLGHNLIGNATGVVFDSTEPSDQIGTSGSPIDPLLGPLADNGGPTLTHALLTGSPAIDAGTDVAIDTTTVTTEQRGYSRVFGSQADIGSFEFGAGPTDTTPPTGSFSAVTSPRNTNFGTVTVTFSEDVQNVDITDFALTRDLSIVDISGLSVSTVAADEYTIDLSGVTGAEGGYFFGYDGSNNDIQDLAGNDVTGTPTIIAIVDTTVPTSSAAITDATQVGGDIDGGSYTAADNAGGSGLASVELYVKEPGQPWASAGAITGGTFSFTPTQGDGTYEFATVATDNATNGETAPTGSDSGDIAVVYNDATNSSFTHAAVADGSYSFPMTDALDVVITFSGGASGGPITVSRTTGDNAPVGLDAAKLIDEFLSITGTFSGTASILWNFDGASDDTLSGSLTTVYQFDSGSQAGQYTVTPSGDSLTINGVTAFSEWYAGDVSATEDEWSLLD